MAKIRVNGHLKDADIKKGMSNVFLSLLAGAREWRLSTNRIIFVSLGSDALGKMEIAFPEGEVFATLSSFYEDKALGRMDSQWHFESIFKIL